MIYAGETLYTLVPSADTTGVTDAARIMAAYNALPAAGGRITLNPGIWYIKCGQVIIPRSAVWIDAPGCTINAVGSGDVFRMYDTTNPVGRSPNGGGFTGRPVIDGTNAGANSSGIHFGDIAIGKIEAIIQNFTGAGSTNLLLDNHFWWTEENDIRVASYNSPAMVTFTTSGVGTQSFAYGQYDFTLGTQTNQQTGIAVTNGAFIYHASLRLRGNFASGAATTTAAVIAISGQNGASQPSAIDDCRFDVQVECSSGGAHSPTTITAQTSPFNSTYACSGILDFGLGSGAFSPTTLTPAQILFTGTVLGDTNLSPGNAGGFWVNVGAPILYTVSSGAGGNVATQISDFSTLTLAASITINLNPVAFNLGKTNGIAQRVTIVITQAAAGGPFTVTWPHTGSPTTSSPTVKWAGGTAPTMTAAANSVDVYDLETADGITWYGRATQNVS